MAFLRLGLTSFGGPIAHLGYFQREFVQRRRWLDDAGYAQLLGLCQFLPGPASSQLGFAIGLQRAGVRGALAAFAGFTLPSALLMVAFALLSPSLLATASGEAVVHGLKLVAVAVVAQGLWMMTRKLTPDLSRVAIAAIAAALLLISGNAWLQLAAITGGAAVGVFVCRDIAPQASPALVVGVPRVVALTCGGMFAVGLLLALLLPVPASPTLLSVSAAFYRAGALVFGGGHVVLPLLERSVVDPGWLPAEDFLSDYGAAQAVPGPMFTLAAALGAAIAPGGHALPGAAVALLAVFLPGFLLLLAVLPVWSALLSRPMAVRALAGINAAVVGVLAAALVDPVALQGLRSVADVAIATVGIVLLATLRRGAVLATLAWCVGASLLLMLWP